jgi:hypothetical protein
VLFDRLKIEFAQIFGLSFDFSGKEFEELPLEVVHSQLLFRKFGFHSLGPEIGDLFDFRG